MATVGDLKVARVVEDGTGVLVELGGLGQSEEDVQGRERVGALLELIKMTVDLAAQFEKLLVLQPLGALLRAEDLVLQIGRASCRERV